jgi:sporulation protein YlmC with PRC-barrel domain
MRLSELLGREVRDQGDAYLGTVADVVLSQDGPMRGAYSAGLRVSGLILVERRHVRLLGYEREWVPWIQRAVVTRLAGRVLHVRWGDVLLRDDGLLQMHPGSGPARDHDAGYRRAVAR